MASLQLLRVKFVGAQSMKEVLPPDRRYRDIRGEDDPYTSEDPDYPQGRLDQI